MRSRNTIGPPQVSGFHGQSSFQLQHSIPRSHKFLNCLRNSNVTASGLLHMRVPLRYKYGISISCSIFLPNVRLGMVITRETKKLSRHHTQHWRVPQTGSTLVLMDLRKLLKGRSGKRQRLTK